MGQWLTSFKLLDRLYISPLHTLNQCIKSQVDSITCLLPSDKLYNTDEVPRCECDGVVKPDVVFFGEQLPKRFFEQLKWDFPRCDLLLIMGTSLVVQPFCTLIDEVDTNVLRVLINDKKVGTVSWIASVTLQKQMLGV